VRVGDLIEDRDKTLPHLQRAKNLVEIARGQGITEERDTLMHGAGRKKPPDRIGLDGLGRHGAGDLYAQLADGARREHGAPDPAPRIGESGTGCMDPVQPECAGATFRLQALLVLAAMRAAVPAPSVFPSRHACCFPVQNQTLAAISEDRKRNSTSIDSMPQLTNMPASNDLAGQIRFRRMNSPPASD
jgi:hypothetical protein